MHKKKKDGMLMLVLLQNFAIIQLIKMIILIQFAFVRTKIYILFRFYMKFKPSTRVCIWHMINPILIMKT